MSCYKCEKRYIGCHADCADYVEWKTEHESKRQAIRDAKGKERIANEYRFEQINKRKMERGIKA